MINFGGVGSEFSRTKLCKYRAKIAMTPSSTPTYRPTRNRYIGRPIEYDHLRPDTLLDSDASSAL